MDLLLRRPYLPGTPFGAAGETIWATSPQGWGFRDSVYWRRAVPAAELRPFLLDVRADGDEISVGDALYRPSHVTLHGLHEASGLQITEDKFLTEDDAVVSVFSVRNPGEYTVEFQLDYSWGMPQGENHIDGESVWIRRDAPPGDDLRQRFPSGARRTFVFVVAFADSREKALQRSLSWRDHPDPVRAQSEMTQRWFDANMPRFDCSDPWITKLWYHRWQQLWRLRGESNAARQEIRDVLAAADVLHEAGLDVGAGRQAARGGAPGDLLAAVTRFAEAQFESGLYELPGTEADRTTARPVPSVDEPAFATVVLEGLLGIQRHAAGPNDDLLVVRPGLPPVQSGGWSHFCAENIPHQGRMVTMVWDDPSDPSTDAYQDGDKGLSVYSDGRRIYHQEDLAPFTVELPL